MTVRRNVYIRCDDCGTLSQGSDTLREERRESRFKLISGRDICPECQEENR